MDLFAAMMPFFYLHLRCGENLAEDQEGSDLPDLAAARAEALRMARVLWGDMLFRGCTPTSFQFDIADTAGQVLLTVPFAEVLSPPAPR